MIDVKKFLEDEKVSYRDDLIKDIQDAYDKYSGKQDWTASALDYTPTKKVTNLTKYLINMRSRFMFGKEPYFNYEDDSKSELIADILRDNKFHSKLLKARKDCSIGGKIAIKLWANEGVGLKVIFVTASNFFVRYNSEDVSVLEKIVYLYEIEGDEEEPNVKKQSWELVDGKCILNESLHKSDGSLIEQIEEDKDTGLDFIPSIIVINGGLTGEVDGVSDVLEMWSNQLAYNKITSDDIDALKFQMFGQNVATDASGESLSKMVTSPGALIDLQTDLTHANEGRQAKLQRLESGFSYMAKFEDTVQRVKNDMYDMMSVPNVGIDQLKGVVSSGKSMKALYWALIAACEEDWTEWNPALQQLAEYIMKMVAAYNLYDSKAIASSEKDELVIEHYYPIQEDEDDQKAIDMNEVMANVRSRESYIKKWQEVEDASAELKLIQLEKQIFDVDNYGMELMGDVSGSDDESTAQRGEADEEGTN